MILCKHIGEGDTYHSYRYAGPPDGGLSSLTAGHL
jgi:hypothetical protein